MAIPRRAPARYDKLTRDQLVARLRDLEAVDPVQELDETRRLLHDLEVHQVQLEMQNRELREAHALLEESRARLADLYDFAPVVYVTLSRDGQIGEANLTAAAMFGIPRGKLIGKPLAAFVAESHRRTLRQHLDRCLHDHLRAETDLQISVRGQALLIVHAVSVPVIAADGAVTGCKTTLTDVTAARRAHDKLVFLAHASAILGSSFDYRATMVEVARQAVPVMADICIVDLLGADGRLQRLEVAFADPAAADRLTHFLSSHPRADDGTAAGKVIRTKHPLLFPECSPTSLASLGDGYDHEILIKVSGARSMMVVPMVARDVVLGVLTFIATASGRQYTDTSLSTARDLASHAALAIENARLYERVRDAVRAREDMLSFVSHDLRNPLMGIQLTTESLLHAVPEQERRKGWKQLERIRRGTRQMRRMIDDLLDVTSMEAGRLTLATAPQEAARLADDAVVLLAPIANEKQLSLVCEASREPLIVRCDRDRVIQVLSNLVGNAIKFTPAGGAVTVSAARVGAQALFSVRDTGPGISPVLRPHIFERFWQAEETARKGRGLGLYIAKGLVEAQGGAIWVDSPPQGGTTFSFTVPLASAAEVDRFRATMETTRGSLGDTPIVGSG